MSSGWDNDKELISIETQAQFELEHHVGSGTKTVTWTDGRTDWKRAEKERRRIIRSSDGRLFFRGNWLRQATSDSWIGSAADPLGREKHFNRSRKGRNSYVWTCKVTTKLQTKDRPWVAREWKMNRVRHSQKDATINYSTLTSSTVGGPTSPKPSHRLSLSEPFISEMERLKEQIHLSIPSNTENQKPNISSQTVWGIKTGPFPAFCSICIHIFTSFPLL